MVLAPDEKKKKDIYQNKDDKYFLGMKANAFFS